MCKECAISSRLSPRAARFSTSLRLGRIVLRPRRRRGRSEPLVWSELGIFGRIHGHNPVSGLIHDARRGRFNDKFAAPGDTQNRGAVGFEHAKAVVELQFFDFAADPGAGKLDVGKHYL